VEENKYQVQFSADGSFYHVPAFPLKHAWLTVETFESPEHAADKFSMVMPYTGLCRFARGKRTYYRMFANQSYFAVRAGKVEDRSADDPMVEDFVASKAEPLTADAEPLPSGERTGKAARKRARK
jgi:hypothetical protein